MTSNTSGKSSGARRRDRRLREIEEAARTLFGTRGYEETSLAEIADEVDLSPKALYYYFDSKRALLEAILEHGFVYFESEGLSEARKEWSELNLRDALVESSVAAVETIIGHADLLRLSFSETFRGDEATRARHETYMASWVEHVSSIMEEGPRKKAIKRARRQPVAELIVGSLLGLSVDCVLRAQDHTLSSSDGLAARRAYVETLVDVTLTGVTSA